MLASGMFSGRATSGRQAASRRTFGRRVSGGRCPPDCCPVEAPRRRRPAAPTPPPPLWVPDPPATQHAWFSLSVRSQDNFNDCNAGVQQLPHRFYYCGCRTCLQDSVQVIVWNDKALNLSHDASPATPTPPPPPSARAPPAAGPKNVSATCHHAGRQAALHGDLNSYAACNERGQPCQTPHFQLIRVFFDWIVGGFPLVLSWHCPPHLGRRLQLLLRGPERLLQRVLLQLHAARQRRRYLNARLRSLHPFRAPAGEQSSRRSAAAARRCRPACRSSARHGAH